MKKKDADALNAIFREAGFWDIASKGVGNVSTYMIGRLGFVHHTYVSPKQMVELLPFMEDPNNPCRDVNEDVEVLFTRITNDNGGLLRERASESLKLAFANARKRSGLCYGQFINDDPRDAPKGPTMGQFIKEVSKHDSWMTFDWDVFAEAKAEIK